MKKKFIRYNLDDEKEYEKLLEFFNEKEFMISAHNPHYHEVIIFDASDPLIENLEGNDCVCGSYKYMRHSNLRILDVYVGSRLERVIKEFNSQECV